MSYLKHRQIRDYQIFELIGRGATSAIYRAQKGGLSKNLAIKIIAPEIAHHPTFRHHFTVEVALASRLRHAYIVPIEDYWQDATGAYIVMPLLPNCLRNELDAHPRGLSLARIAMVFNQLAAGLSVAHEQGIIHCDLKPGNILIDKNGNVRISDFGLAQIASAQMDDPLQGTPAYSAPEQLLGQVITTQTDIYALGVLLFEMLTGKQPFLQASDVHHLVRLQNEWQWPAIKSLRIDSPDALDAIIQQATALQPEARFSNLKLFNAAVQMTLADHHSERKSDVMAMNNPYRGLLPFTEADMAHFVGRDDLLRRIRARLSQDMPESNFLALVGAAGIGKTSLIHAGLIPMLRSGQLLDTRDWLILDVLLTEQPVAALQQTLFNSVDLSPHARQQLEAESDDFVTQLQTTLKSGQRAMIILDRFERIFHLRITDEERQAFLNLLLHLLTTLQHRVFVILTLRVDALGQLMQMEGYDALLRERTEFVTLLKPSDFERAMIEPAERLGLTVDRDLQTMMLAHIRGEKDALSLMQYALKQTFTHRKGEHLTLSAYMEVGGALTAISQQAERVYGQLDDSQKNAAKALFQQLVLVAANGQYDLLSLRWDAYCNLQSEHAGLDTVRDNFLNEGLLILRNDPQTEEPIVELASLVVVRRWPRLRDWLTTPSPDGQAAIPSNLLQMRRMRSRLLGLVAILVLFAAFSTIANIFIANQWQQSQTDSLLVRTEVAVAQARIDELETNVGPPVFRNRLAHSRFLALSATEALANGDEDLALALAVEAVDMPDFWPEAVVLLADLLGVPSDDKGLLPTAEELVTLARTEFDIPELTCEQRATYRIEPQCE